MPAASRRKNANAVTEPPQDPERWRDIQANVRKMDDLYDATFYTWLRSEDNVLVTASYLQRLAGDYDLERIEHALCWLVADWRLESIAILLRQVTFDWAQKGEQGEKDRARLVLSITENWAIQYVARLVCALLSNASMPLYVSPVIPHDPLNQFHAFPNSQPPPMITPHSSHPTASPHTSLDTQSALLQGRRMAVGNEVAAVAAAAAASVSASSQSIASPTSTSSPTTPTTGSFQHQLPRLLPALTPGSSPTPPPTSPLAPAPITFPISASSLSSRSRAQLSTNAGGSMTLPRSARLSSQRRPTPAQTSLQAVLHHDTQRYSHSPQTPATAQISASSSLNATSHSPVPGQTILTEPQQVSVAPQYASGFQPTHQRSQTTNGVVSAGSGQHDLSRHARPNGQGVVYNATVQPHAHSNGMSNVPLTYQQPQPQLQHLQPTFRGHLQASQQRTYAFMEHSSHISSTSMHAMPSPAVTPVASRLASPLTSPVSRTSTPYPSAPKPSWCTQQSSMNTNPVFYVNKPLFMECLAKKWSFCKLSEFFQSLDAAAGISVRLKCTLLKNTALKEEEQMRRASPLPGSNSGNNKAEAQSRNRESVPSAQPEPQAPRVPENVSTSTTLDQSRAQSSEDSMMDMDMDQDPAPCDPVSPQTSTQVNQDSSAQDPAIDASLHRESSPTIVEEDTLMAENSPTPECKRATTDENHTPTDPQHMNDSDYSTMCSLQPLIPESAAAHSRGPSSAPPSRGRTMNSIDNSHQDFRGHEYTNMHLDRQAHHPDSTLQHSAVDTTPPMANTRANSRTPSVSAPIIVVAADGSALENTPTAGNQSCTGSHTGSNQENGIHVSPTLALGTGHQVSIHPLDSYSYSQTSLHPFSREPETNSIMTQACAALQTKTELPSEQGWREPQVNPGSSEQHQQSHPQQQSQRGHSQHSRAQTSDAVLSNTLARAAMASNALSTLSLSDPKCGTMDDESMSMTSSTISLTTGTLGVAGGRRFLNQEQNMSRSLCIESNSTRGRHGADEAGGGNTSMFGTSRSLRRLAALGMQHTDDDNSSRVTTPSKRKNSLGVTTLQHSPQDGSPSSSSSVSVSRCSNLFSNFSLTSNPSPMLASLSPSPPPSSSSSPTSTCTTSSLGSHGSGTAGSSAHFFMTSNSTTQSLPGTRRTSTCTSTTDEDLKRVRCSRPGSISGSDLALNVSSLSTTSTSSITGATVLSSSPTQASASTSIPASSSILTLSSTSSSTHDHNANSSSGLSLSSTTARF